MKANRLTQRIVPDALLLLFILLSSHQFIGDKVKHFLPNSQIIHALNQNYLFQLMCTWRIKSEKDKGVPFFDTPSSHINHLCIIA
jgi:hypothetical protein